MTTPKAASSTLYSRTLRTLGIGVLALSLWGCDWVGALKSKLARAEETFTFKGQLPAEFGIDAIAFYGPDKPVQANCQYQTFEAKTANRWYGKRYSAAIQAQPQDFSFEIPLSYYKDSCSMRLGRVKLEIKVRYGEEKWQKTYANGNFWIEAENEDSVAFNKHGEINIKAICSLMFQESKLYFGISKLMSCKSAGASLPRGKIKNKTVNLTTEVKPDEEPARHETWIKFPEGWKPCLPKKGWQSCQTPPVFKDFKMNGQTCTVYPSCKE